MLDPSVMVEMNIDFFSQNKNVKSILYIYIAQYLGLNLHTTPSILQPPLLSFYAHI